MDNTPTKSHTPGAAGSHHNGNAASLQVPHLLMQASEASSPAASNASSSIQQHRAPKHSKPTAIHVQHSPATSAAAGAPPVALQGQWAVLLGNIKGNAQSSAELLMRQAASTAQLEQLVNHLLRQLQEQTDARQQAESQLKHDRAEFTAQAKLLSQHFTTAQHRSTALQVVHESLQAELHTVKAALEASQQEAGQLTEELASSRGQVLQQAAQISTLEEDLAAQTQSLKDAQQQCEEQRLLVKELRSAKTALQSQLSSMVAAERELTEHLKTTHKHIEEQLLLLQGQLKNERQRRLQISRRKADLSQRVVELNEQVAALTSQLQGGQGTVQHLDTHVHDQAQLRKRVLHRPLPARPVWGGRATHVGGKRAGIRLSTNTFPSRASAASARSPSLSGPSQHTPLSAGNRQHETAPASAHRATSVTPGSASNSRQASAPGAGSSATRTTTVPRFASTSGATSTATPSPSPVLSPTVTLSGWSAGSESDVSIGPSMPTPHSEGRQVSTSKVGTVSAPAKSISAKLAPQLKSGPASSSVRRQPAPSHAAAASTAAKSSISSHTAGPGAYSLRSTASSSGQSAAAGGAGPRARAGAQQAQQAEHATDTPDDIGLSPTWQHQAVQLGHPPSIAAGSRLQQQQQQRQEEQLGHAAVVDTIAVTGDRRADHASIAPAAGNLAPATLQPVSLLAPQQLAQLMATPSVPSVAQSTHSAMCSTSTAPTSAQAPRTAALTPPPFMLTPHTSPASGLEPTHAVTQITPTGSLTQTSAAASQATLQAAQVEADTGTILQPNSTQGSPASAGIHRSSSTSLRGLRSLLARHTDDAVGYSMMSALQLTSNAVEGASVTGPLQPHALPEHRGEQAGMAESSAGITRPLQPAAMHLAVPAATTSPPVSGLQPVHERSGGGMHTMTSTASDMGQGSLQQQLQHLQAALQQQQAALRQQPQQQAAIQPEDALHGHWGVPEQQGQQQHEGEHQPPPQQTLQMPQEHPPSRQLPVQHVQQLSLQPQPSWPSQQETPQAAASADQIAQLLNGLRLLQQQVGSADHHPVLEQQQQ